jgi:hypothetical protein
MRLVCIDAAGRGAAADVRAKEADAKAGAYKALVTAVPRDLYTFGRLVNKLGCFFSRAWSMNTNWALGRHIERCSIFLAVDRAQLSLHNNVLVCLWWY